jgi:S1-C subfamily serine protease
MKKIFIVLILLFTFTGGYVVADSVNGSFEGNPIIKLFNSGKELTVSDVPAINYKNRTMVPIYLLNQLGIETVWNGDTQSVDIKLSEQKPIPTVTQDELNIISESVLEVHGYTSDPTIYEQGSGVVINNMLVTNVHVGGGAPYVDVIVNGQKVRLNQIIFKNETQDLIAFKIDGQKSLKYSTEITKAGDTVYAIGFPNGKFKITQGEIYNPVFSNLGIDRIVHTAKTEPGTSGGAILNSKGEVIGIMKSNSGDISDAIPIKYVEEELNKLK